MVVVVEEDGGRERRVVIEIELVFLSFAAGLSV